MWRSPSALHFAHSSLARCFAWSAGGLMQKVQFGSLYFGQRRVIRAVPSLRMLAQSLIIPVPVGLQVLLNNSPQSTHFAISWAQGKQPDELLASLDDDSRSLAADSEGTSSVRSVLRVRMPLTDPCFVLQTARTVPTSWSSRLRVRHGASILESSSISLFARRHAGPVPDADPRVRVSASHAGRH